MKKINGYYTDDNSNQWNCEKYTEEQAIEYSTTLINCFKMVNCRDCRSCSSCRDCRSCSFCSSCRDCRSCSDCSDCRSCRDCSDCRSCREFKENPQRYTSARIGSRYSQTAMYWNEEITRVVCGCFNDNIEAFEKTVKATYEEGSKYRLEYDEFIETCKYLINKSR